MRVVVAMCASDPRVLQSLFGFVREPTDEQSALRTNSHSSTLLSLFLSTMSFTDGEGYHRQINLTWADIQEIVKYWFKEVIG